MTQGLQIRNENSEFLIDSTYRNIFLEKQVLNQQMTTEPITGTNDGGTAGMCQLNINPTSVPPFFTFKPSSTYFSNLSIFTDYNTEGIYDEVSFVYERYTTYVNWRCYRENYEESTQTYGLRIYNEKGDLCFDNDNTTLKLHSIVPINLAFPDDVSPSSSLPYTNITHSGIENPYYVLLTRDTSQLGTYVVSQGPPNYKYTSYMKYQTVGLKQLSSTSVRVGWFCFWMTWTYDQDWPISWEFNYGYPNDMRLLIFYP